MSLIDDLTEQGWLKSPEIIKAFSRIKRKDFLHAEKQDLAEINEPIAIGFGQTISQPLVVAFMLELLKPKPGDKILDIGSGSGWTTALLAEIVGEKGRVVSVEIVPELKKFGQENVSKYAFLEKGIVKYILRDGSKGYQKSAPFDKILASASAEEIPSAWKEQAKTGGRIVAPVENSIWLSVKKSETKFEETEYPGFAFVPLVS